MGHFSVIEISIVFLRDPPPGTEMHFIYGHRRIEGIIFHPVNHPFVVIPCVIKVPRNRGCLRGQLTVKGKRISFVDLIFSIFGNYMIFVDIPLFNTRNKSFPYS
jgi:hypothetical protein